MKKIYIILLLIFLIFILKSCVNVDLPETEDINDKTAFEQIFSFHPSKRITRTIKGIDYLESQAERGKFGGNLISSTIGEGPKTFNPWNSKDATSSLVGNILFEGLLTTDAYTGEVIPKLAKNFEILKDKKTYIINLRHGIKWSDGVEITADDVVFTWEKLIFGGFGNTSTRDSLYINGILPKIEKINDYRVKFTTPMPFAPFLRTLSANIAPKHVFEPVLKKGKKNFEQFYSSTTEPTKLVTSGAFKLKEYVPAQRIIFERNPDYYVINKNVQKLPYLDKYIILIVGDLNNEILKFEAKELDIINLQGANVSRFKQKEKNSDYKIYNLGPTTSTQFFVLNLNERKDKNGKFYVNPIKQKWFNDLNFRTALDYVIDRDNMIFNIAAGTGKPLFTAESLSSIFLNQNIAKGHKRNIEFAKKLLEKSGFYLDKKGFLHDKTGNIVEFDLSTNSGNTQREAIGVMIKEDLAQLGIKVNFKPLEFNSLVNKLNETLNWDSMIIGLTGSPLEPHGGINVWNSKGTLHLFNKRKQSESLDDRKPFEIELDNIFDKAALELNFNKRKALYERYQQIIYDNRAIIYLYSTLDIVAIRKKFKNIYPTHLSGLLHNLDEIYSD